MKIQIITHHKCQLNCPPCIRTILKPNSDVMSMETFYNIMEILPELDNVDLTPMIGDPLLDKHLIERMDYLEQSPKVKHFDFVTNLLALTPEVLDKLFTYKKFGMFISLYSDNGQHYADNTGTKYGDLFPVFREKLELLYDTIGEKRSLPFPITFYSRGCFYKYMDKSQKNLAGKIANMWMVFKHVTIDESHANKNYNWGGQHLNVENPVQIPKERNGICLHAVEQNCIFPNGDVTVCGMVDIHKKMLLGNIISDGMNVFDTKIDMNLCQGCNEYESQV